VAPLQKPAVDWCFRRLLGVPDMSAAFVIKAPAAADDGAIKETIGLDDT
jgi:hypothetical protein